MRRPLFSELEALYLLSTDLICVASADGLLRRMNPAWEKALGYRAQEVVGRPWMDLVHPEDKEATAQAARGMEGSEPVSFTNRYRHKDGTWVKLSWRATAWSAGLTYAIARVLP